MKNEEYKKIMCQNCVCTGEDIQQIKIIRNEYEKECSILVCVNYKRKEKI